MRFRRLPNTCSRPALRAGTLRPLAVLTVSAGATFAALFHSTGCQQSPITVPVRSLEQSGKVSFVCLGPPGPAGNVEHPLGDCSTQLFTDINEYLYEDDAGDIDAGGGVLPHLYALVTQTTRGEVAVVDTSSTQRQVLDENPVEPGANFLPIGAQPTGIVSTPGSIATFVGVAEIGRAGIFALPSTPIPATQGSPGVPGIRPSNADFGTGGFTGGGGYGGAFASGAAQVPQLSSWPACSLPAAPGDMILVNDPVVDGLERPTCDDAYAPINPGDLISSVEGLGRQKLVLTIPALGGIAVIDAQTLLNQKPGQFDACPVERWLPLEVDLTGQTVPAAPQPPPGAACVYPRQLPAEKTGPYTPQPGGLTYADGKLYVADQAAPVIHVVEMPSPCDPIERAPLVPYSAEDPQRVVLTGRVSVSPAPTPDYKRYLYATDIEDGSVMAFDVGPNSTTRRPLVRKNAQLNPFMSRDRVHFGSPVADILVVQRDAPETNPVTGIAVAGVRCNADPSLLLCTATSTSCDIATAYRTNTDNYTTGANPAKLRGTFAFAALTSGRLAVIDIDDFDADCRGPTVQSTLEGCAADADGQRKTSLEQSCNIVEPGAPRAANFEVVNDTVGSHTPALANFPLLYDANGGLIDYANGPAMVPPPLRTGTTLPREPSSSPATACAADVDCGLSGTCVNQICTNTAGYYTFVANSKVDLGVASSPDKSLGDQASQHILQMRYAEPRAHLIDQNWVVVFEGALPGFANHVGDMRDDGVPPGLYDINSRFCDSGVMSEEAMKETYAAAFPDKKAGDWARFADYVQITSELPDQMDPYWTNLKTTASSCQVNFNECQQIFGTFETPTANRDLRIKEAYQDHVELLMRPPPAPTGACGDIVEGCHAGEDCVTGADNKKTCVPQQIDGVDLSTVKCCFPDVLSFAVRVGDQWAVLGDQTNFLHHVVADPSSDPTRAGRCRNSCDAATMLKNGRVVEVDQAFVDALKSPTAPQLPADDPRLLVNPMFQFLMRVGPQRSVGPADRDKVFRFSTQGAFIPLLVTLSSDPTVLVQPQGLAFVPPTGEIAITDGASNGIIFVSLTSSTLSRSFF